ncbi:TPA: hypothetical protein DIC38_01525 [Candidatus Nomurabacteria bacterium]|nr:MAG: hypothetical protein O210_OD1C00001G0427 [Parcubacteria bacterium RAAC4_OD1_1]HCY26341.1 hypothetical protein [Candidatus Nomurabacteria bacterium]
MKFLLIAKKIFLAIGILALYEILIKGFIFIITKIFEGDLNLILLIVIPSTFIIRCVIIKTYDKNKIDIFGIEAIKAKIEIEKETMIAKIIKILLGISKIAVYVIVLLDPTATVIYFRKGSKLWNGIPDKITWALFILSNIICSITITLSSLGILKIF